MSVALFSPDKHIVYKNRHGITETVMAREAVMLSSSAGLLIPQYSDIDSTSRKKEAALSFYPNGMIKSCPLEEAMPVTTPIGEIRAELVTFYESGAIKRVFPLNGKLTAYWSQENEYMLAEELALPTSLGEISIKPIFVQFFENGELEIVSFWPDEKVPVKTDFGWIEIRSGISFHRNGSLRSCEPAQPYSISTPLGTIEAWTPDPDGLASGDWSLAFTDQKKIRSLQTITTAVAVMKDAEMLYRFTPMVIPSICSESEKSLVPLTIGFSADSVSFSHKKNIAGEVPLSSEFMKSRFEPDTKPRPSCH